MMRRLQQLRICSGHFRGGRKCEGDIPVADPDVDDPIRIDVSSLTAVKHAEKSPKCRRASPAAGTPARQKVAASKHTSVMVGLRPSAAKEDVSPVIGFSGCTAAELLKNEMEMTAVSRPLVVLLDGRDCSVEMPLLKDIAQVAFCDADSILDVHVKVLNEAVGVLVYGGMSLQRDDLIKFKSLKVIISLGICGPSNVDVTAAGQLGIAVCELDNQCVEEAADTTLCLILNMYRRTYWLARDVGVGSRRVTCPEQLFDLAAGASRINGQTLGIVGFGRVGRAVALRAKSFGFHIIFHDSRVADGTEKAFGVSRAESINQLLAASDCITLHCGRDQHSPRPIINQHTIRQMRRGVRIVNTSAGSLVDEEALTDALQQGHVQAAALDSYNVEPFFLANSPLRDCPNVLLTPRTARYSDQGLMELRQLAAEEMRRAVIGQTPASLPHCINARMLPGYFGQDGDTSNLLHSAKYQLSVHEESDVDVSQTK